MKFIADTSLPGIGDISGVFRDDVRELLAVGCSFRLLTEPRARAAYSGHRPRYRVAIYEQGRRTPKAFFDRLSYGVNDIAFHPTMPVMAIATGRYDGGWRFEGELILWNWETGDFGLVVDSIPEVMRVAFDGGGDNILAIIRPWDEGVVEDRALGEDPFDIFFEIQAAFSSSLQNGLTSETDVTDQMTAQKPVSKEGMITDARFAASLKDFETAISRHCKIDKVLSRSPIWDVKWLDHGGVAFVHDDCHLEVIDRSEAIRRFSGEGHGCEILAGPTLRVHVTSDRDSKNWHDSRISRIFRLENDELIEEKEFIGSHTISVSNDGRMIVRRNRSGAPSELEELEMSDHWFKDGEWHEVKLGLYDVFNHYIRVDGTPYLFFVQNDQPNRDQLKDFPAGPKKWLCILETNGTIRCLWRILPDDGTYASTVNECSYEFLPTDGGGAMVVAGKRYDPNPSKPFLGFIYRKELSSGDEMWRAETPASPTVIRYLKSRDLIAAFFLNGDQMLIEASSGAIIRQARFVHDQMPSIIFSCDVRDDEMVLGTVDGRVVVISVDEFAVHKQA
jgi:hypothetical protein